MQNTVLVNFSTFPFCFRTITVNDFTNKLINEKEYTKNNFGIIEYAEVEDE